ncbi:patatin-like phospholipase family protein [Inhella gelatinilytica]|uniref:Patatin-like phospholipase family protein n=1 Tax=Inhella gelatinilytica TaxID=2795030 RepID=A0A931IYF5_9BURK|nr:patatin-like phospholipase family protein [Inhella gelatinilytica]MBH9553379.1 patatin-like phospholipase family protein [Inhella gelatinilytica]
MTTTTPSTGLILTGGGARAAYQIGVLQGIAQIKRDAGVGGNPFQVISGTSAGAINAAALACEADHFDGAVDALVRLWSRLHVEQIYRADAFGVMRTGGRWVTMMTLGWAIQRWRKSQPRSLLDNEPLGELLKRTVRFERLPKIFAGGHLDALAVTGSSYSTGHHITFYQSRQGVEPWFRSQRSAVEAPITHKHLLASSAIPFIFPAQTLELAGSPEWFGDGSMRQNAPISPAIHLGAERVLVIGAGRMQEAGAAPDLKLPVGGYPSMAQIAGHAMSNIFLDALAVDIERLQRINKTLALLPPDVRDKTPLRPVDVLVIAPSRRLDEMAGEHQHELPATMRALLGTVGVTGKGSTARGSVLASYLLFESGYTTELILLGMTDTLNRRADVLKFFGWPSTPMEPSWRRLLTPPEATFVAKDAPAGGGASSLSQGDPMGIETAQG